MRYALILTALLAGCASNPGLWVHPTIRGEQARSDLAQCRFEATRAASPVVMRGALEQAIEQARVRNEVGAACMQARGYVLTFPEPPGSPNAKRPGP
jgi:hypothetical protein